MSQEGAALQHYLEQGEISLGEVLVIQGTPEKWADCLEEKPTVVSFNAKESKNWLDRGVHTLQQIPEGVKFDTIIHFGTKFHHENLAHLGHYSRSLKSNESHWVSIIANKMGSNQLQKSLGELFCDVRKEGKSKCKVFTAKGEINEIIQKKWSAFGKVKEIDGTQLLAKPGVFSADKIDKGSLVLAEILKQESWYGKGADFGAAYGYLSSEILKLPRQKVHEIHLYEVDSRALDCARINLEKYTQPSFHWKDVTALKTVEKSLDWIIMNPPFHEGKATNIELGITFIRKAAEVLKSGGCLYLVANLHLPYEKVLQELFRSHRLLVEKNGFKCFLARK